MTNREAINWLEKNTTWFTYEGNTARCIYLGKGYEYISNEGASLKLYLNVQKKNYQYRNPAINHNSYVPELYELDTVRGW